MKSKGCDTPSRRQTTSASRRLCQGQKAVLEHAAMTTADCQLHVRSEYNCLYQQVSSVYIRHSKRETSRPAEVQNVSKAVLAFQFEYQS